MAVSAIFANPFSVSFSKFGHKETLNNEKAPTNKELFKEITVVKALNKAKFPVYLISSKLNKKNYAMKVFPFKNKHSHPYFHNELRFARLNHENVVNICYAENEKETLSKGVVSKVSYTIMEYAPNGDFFDFVMNHSAQIDEKLARSYFRQLIQGLEYLHSQGVSHMDLKLENLLMDENYNLKIADFDLSYVDGDSKVLSKGTKFYRAPDVMNSVCTNTRAADIYAAGIVLFTFKSRGILAHSENNLIGGVNFAELLHNNDPKFWTKHAEVQKKDISFFDQDFKDLFISMTRPKPSDRISIEEIKKSKWYNGPCCTPEELKSKVSKILGH